MDWWVWLLLAWGAVTVVTVLLLRGPRVPPSTGDDTPRDGRHEGPAA